MGWVGRSRLRGRFVDGRLLEPRAAVKRLRLGRGVGPDLQRAVN